MRKLLYILPIMLAVSLTVGVSNYDESAQAGHSVGITLSLVRSAHAQDATATPTAATEPTEAESTEAEATKTKIPADVAGGIGLITKIFSAFAKGEYALGFGFLLMLLVFVTRTWLLKKISKEWVGIATLALPVMVSVGTGLVAGVDPGTAVVSGLLVGGAAMLFWQSLLKKILRKWMGKEKFTKLVNGESTDG